MNRKSLSRIASLLVVSAFTVVARASDSEFRVGGGRTFGLAGTGIALPLDVYETSRLNPALLGIGSKKFQISLPYAGYRSKGLSLSDFDDLDTGSDVSDDTAITLARRFGDEIKEVGLSAGGGASYAGFAFRIDAELSLRSVPNAPLKAFLAQDDPDFDEPFIDSRLDAYGLGTVEAGLSYGYALPLKKSKDRFSVGATVRSASAFYAHKIADAAAIATDSNGNVRNGSEFSDDDDDVIRRSGVGVDFGGLASLHTLPNAYFGFNVKNAVEPNIEFVRTSPNTDAPLRRDLRPFRRQLGVGASYVKERYLVAADLVDLGNNAGVSGFRFGAEYSLSKYLAVRGGYDSRSRFVVGLNLGGVNVGIASDGTSTLATALRF